MLNWLQIRIDISKVDENQLVLYAQMANLVSLILPLIELDLKEIAHTFSKVIPIIMFHHHDDKLMLYLHSRYIATIEDRYWNLLNIAGFRCHNWAYIVWNAKAVYLRLIIQKVLRNYLDMAVLVLTLWKI